MIAKLFSKVLNFKPMKETAYPLRKAIIEAIQASGNFQGAPLAAFDTEAPAGQPFPYVILGSITDAPSDASTKTDFFTEVFAVLDVVTGFQGRGGRMQSEAITDQLLGALVPISTADYLDLGPDFKVCDVVKAGTKEATAKAGVYSIFRKLTTLKFHIQQLTY